jgi:hypothetical protein
MDAEAYAAWVRAGGPLPLPEGDRWPSPAEYNRAQDILAEAGDIERPLYMGSARVAVLPGD